MNKYTSGRTVLAFRFSSGCALYCSCLERCVRSSHLQCYTMKVVTWNINGIRAFRGGIKKALDSLDADVICIQETKVTRKWLAIAGLKTRELSSCKAPQLEWNCMKIKTLTPNFSSTGDLLDERIAIVDGYNSYFSYSRGRSGYSGSIQSYITVHFASVSLESVSFFFVYYHPVILSAHIQESAVF